jgi:deazaflavin-dependent oxidoreductase (nitroreductase family)
MRIDKAGVPTKITAMPKPNRHDRKRRLVSKFQRWFANPVTRRLPTQLLLETTGRTSGRPRLTPVGGRLVDRQFWLVSEHGDASNYVRNIKADNAVRIRIGGRWHSGTAHLLPDDDARARLKQLPRFNSALVAALGTNPLTLRIDLAD